VANIACSTFFYGYSAEQWNTMTDEQQSQNYTLTDFGDEYGVSYDIVSRIVKAIEIKEI
jgi:hypothetical protein